MNIVLITFIQQIFICANGYNEGNKRKEGYVMMSGDQNLINMLYYITIDLSKKHQKSETQHTSLTALSEVKSQCLIPAEPPLYLTP